MNPTRKALIGITGVLTFVGLSVWEIGRRNLWFEQKAVFYTHTEDADGLREGSLVTIAGLRVGEVTNLEVQQDDRILVTFQVMKRLAHKVKEDTEARIVRTFVIGDKRVNLMSKSNESSPLQEGATIPGVDAADLTEFMSGEKLSLLMTYVERLLEGSDALMGELEGIVGAYKSGNFDRVLGLIEPGAERFTKLADDLLELTKEIKRNKDQIPTLLKGGNQLISRVDRDLFQDRILRKTLIDADEFFGPFAERKEVMRRILANLDDLSRDLVDHPDFGSKLVGTLDELKTTLKALQKTWLLESHVRDVKAH